MAARIVWDLSTIWETHGRSWAPGVFSTSFQEYGGGGKSHSSLAAPPVGNQGLLPTHPHA